MKKVLTITFTLILALVLMCTVAYGAELSDVLVHSDMKIGEVNVSGIVVADVKSDYVSVVITNENVIKEELNVESLERFVLATAQAAVDADGKFAAKLVLREEIPTGTYKAFITPQYGDSTEVNFAHESRGIINLALKEINSAGAEILAAITANKVVLGVESFYEAIGFDRENYTKILLCIKPQEGFSNVSQLKGKMSIAEKILNINNARDEEELAVAIEQYSQVIEFKGEEYKNLYSTVKSDLAQRIINETFESDTTFESFYMENKVIASVIFSPNYSYIKKELSADDMKRRLSSGAAQRLMKLNYPEEVYKAIYRSRGRLTTVEKIISEFESEIEKQYASENVHSGPGGGTGGGSSGSSGGVSVPLRQDIEEKLKFKFTDVSKEHWAYESIIKLAEKSIVSGSGNGEFYPDNNITREEFTKIIVGAFEISNVGKTISFDDVPEEEWFFPYIIAATASGAVRGEGEGKFGVGRYITREDLVVMAYRAATNRGFYVGTASLGCADAEAVSDYAMEGVAALQKAGIINGMEDGTFAPKENATRAQAAKIICGLLVAINQ